MDQVEVVVDRIHSWTQKEGADAVLRLGGGRELVARRGDERFNAWNQVESLARQKGWPVYVEFVPATHAIRLMLLCTPRVVESVQPGVKGNMTVVFRRAPSYYTLNIDRPDFAAMLALLQDAVQTRREVLVAVQPTTLEILHVEAGK